MEIPKTALWRLAYLDNRLRSGSLVNARQLADELEVSIRTVYRDVEYLRDRLGAPVDYDASRKGYYYTEPSYQLPAISLTEGELLALFLAEKTLQQYQGTPYEQDIRTAFKKIVRFLPEEVSIQLSDLDSFYTFRSSTTTLQDIDAFQTLVSAALERRRVRVNYRSTIRGEQTERDLDPYHLANVDGGWYLFAHCHLRNGVRVFRTDRIERIRKLRKAFERPEGFSPADHLDSAMAIYADESKPKRAILEFDEFASRFIGEKIWHPSQRLVRRKDGTVKLEVRLSSFVELKRFALGWGKHCRVVHPLSLAREMAEEVEEMGAVYRNVS